MDYYQVLNTIIQNEEKAMQQLHRKRNKTQEDRIKYLELRTQLKNLHLLRSLPL